MDEKKIARINELYHKSKNGGLTQEETKEQVQLRAEYIAAIRANLRGTLNQVQILNPDGTVTDLSKKNPQ
ncbi:MAG: DUF896 domain-containing protein [Lachnospiraceae bacterium]|nr:DUF896 domain-containing protein [Lachnospiraceae bacterium]